MGLDMYLFKIKIADAVDYPAMHERFHRVEKNKILNADLPQVFKDNMSQTSPEYMPEYWSVFSQVMSWRKFNALHGYMVERHQNGVDECQLSQPLNVDDLKDIVNACKSESIEPTAGFFFGSTEKDDWYKQNCQETVDVLNKAISVDDGSFVYYYCSSW